MCGQMAKDWNTMPVLRFSGGTKMPFSGALTTLPLRTISPESGRSSPARVRSVVLLPQPLGPRMTRISPP